MSALTHSVLAVILALAIFVSPLTTNVEAFTLTSPSSSFYWVAGETNTLNWKADAGDPEVFDVHLLDEDQKSLNGNFQVGNALKTKAGTAELQIINIPSGQYKMLFTNSSNYEKDKAQVYFTSDVFTVKPHGTPLGDAPPTGDGGSTSQQDGSSSPGANPGGGSSNSTSADAPNTAGQNSTSSVPKDSDGNATKATAPAPVVDHPTATAASGTAKNGTLTSGDSVNAAHGHDMQIYGASAMIAVVLLGSSFAMLG
ncbi:hypothetical protein BCV69DRAFT_300693 [Microstroma glucosiphilum]|uniref:Yeast cell wall synthesis Kre9/Knh1-like N-terminal domain-containing protein n=1 Tax=Pseudomicrostroma glucosiphilum TaxID=1684307 RepID=A0A316U350_9BASI|nr:hypothetical protein BCV69DRAFT_300693 [Pseudomicrostroma glucosiphilum]PWN18901.1 hypothetical protein BCV69DRAFT_300693 [Pseudomicrostroma glucosiphilum]